jgi:predicted Fe-Mo cluster-binding NifX family protein
MKIAIAVDGIEVTQHFGHCDSFVIYDVEEGQVKDQIMLMNPGHVPGVLPQMLIDRGVSCLITGGLGSNAQKIFADAGIDLVMGVQGEAEDVIQNFLAGKLQIGENSCDH